MVNLLPLGEKILTKRIDTRQTSTLYLPDSAKQKQEILMGKVLAKGRGSALHNLRNVNEGDTIFYPSNAKINVPEELTDELRFQYDLTETDELNLVEYNHILVINDQLKGEKCIVSRVVESKSTIIVIGEQKPTSNHFTGVVVVKGISGEKDTLEQSVHCGDKVVYGITDAVPVPDEIKKKFTINSGIADFVEYSKLIGTI